LDGKEKSEVEKELAEADAGEWRLTGELPASRLGDLTGRAELEGWRGRGGGIAVG
jgi:hypothetical protein